MSYFRYFGISSVLYLLRWTRTMSSVLPPTTTTISPLGWFVLKYSHNSVSEPLIVVLCTFDISRETDAGLSAPQTSMSCSSVLTSRNGDSYSINVRSSAANASRRERRPFLGGRKPSKQNLSHGNPELTNAGTNAVAPGRVSTSI